MQAGLPVIDLEQFPKLRTAEYLSPFRYPGGKTFLTGYLASIAENLPASTNVHYVEPYCGGAGAALGLLSQKKIKRAHLNDGDVRVYSAWRAILTENERFIDEVEARPVSLDTWHECREVLSTAGNRYSFDVGFATFFINRTSRAGIVIGSGPIGGYKQNGNWKVDARYYPETIKKRLRWIGKQSNSISISNKDGIDFLKLKAASLAGKPSLYLIDPPYVKAGSRLYLDAMNEEKHRELATFLKSGECENWVLTYDDHPLIRELYKSLSMHKLLVNYSLSRSRKEAELLVHG